MVGLGQTVKNVEFLTAVMEHQGWLLLLMVSGTMVEVVYLMMYYVSQVEC